MGIPDNKLLLTQTAQGTGTENGSSAVIEGTIAAAYLDITASTGTGETLDVVIQAFDAKSSKWITITTFSQQIGVATVRRAVPAAGEFLPDSPIRASGTVGGTTPTFTYTVSISTK